MSSVNTLKDKYICWFFFIQPWTRFRYNIYQETELWANLPCRVWTHCLVAQHCCTTRQCVHVCCTTSCYAHFFWLCVGSLSDRQGSGRDWYWSGRFHPFYRQRRPLGRVGVYSLNLFLYLGTRRGWGVSVTPRPLSTPGKGPLPIVQEAGWVPGPVWTGAENLASTGIFFIA
jgi:hypothetical protein